MLRKGNIKNASVHFNKLVLFLLPIVCKLVEFVRNNIHFKCTMTEKCEEVKWFIDYK